MTTSTDTAALTLLPWVREGAATAITTADAPLTKKPLAPSSSVTVALSVNAGRAAPAVAIQLRGPADVVGVDRSQVVRMDPAPGTLDFEPTHFPLVEFDRPDYPWLFTPAKADENGKLRPWLCLVVVRKQDGVTLGTPPDSRLPALQIAAPALPNVELPDLADVWAWAHGQAAAVDSSAAAVRGALGDPVRSLSRLICPRLLAPNTDYIACVVPTFDVGRKAGLGMPIADAELAPTATMALAWTSATKTIALPVFHHWEFRTGDGGDFASLVQRLRPRPAPEGLGRRAIDISVPGFQVGTSTPPPPVAPIDMEGALRPILAPNAADTMPPWPNAAPFQNVLASIVNAPVVNAIVNPLDDPLLAPPLYGQWHGPQTPVATTGTDWFAQLNLDPRLRAVAAFGTQVVQTHQEALMASAWDQVGEIDKVNQRLRQVQMSVAIGLSLQRRHFATMTSEAAVRVGAPVLPRIRVSDTMTAYAKMSGTKVPVGAIATPMRRVGRQRGPISRRVSAQNATRSESSWVASLDAGTAELPGRPPSALVTISAVAAAGRTINAYPSVQSSTIANYPGVPWFVINPEGSQPNIGLSFTHGTKTFDDLTSMIFRRVAAEHLARLFPTRTQSQGSHVVPSGMMDAMRDTLATATAPASAISGVVGSIVGGGSGSTPSFARAVMPRMAAPNALVPNAVPSKSTHNAMAPNAVAPNAMAANVTPAVTNPPPPPPAPVLTAQFAPKFVQPMSEPLRDLAQDLLLPGVGDVPADTVLGLETNRRFVEAYMVGLNFEMGRELLWRGYPTNRVSTYFANFWGSVADITPLDTWKTRPLGAATGAPAPDHFVMLLRSALLRRYPNALIYLTRAIRTGTTRTPSEAVGDELMPLFTGAMDPDIAYFGFNITSAQATGADGSPGYYVVIQEHPTEPRFGLDEAVAKSLGTASHLVVGAKPPTGLTPPASAVWQRNAAHMATITRRLPVRLAIHASQLLTAP